MSASTLARRDATLKDVAKLAGVSTATVARVLHNSGSVTVATRSLVESAIAETGYHLNVVAQGLRTRRTFTLGHVLQSISPNPFFAGVALGAQEEAARHGCGVVVFNTQGDVLRERSGVQTLIRRRVDAIIFTTLTDEANVQFAIDSGTTVVQVQRVGPAGTHVVTADNQCGAFEATAHLIELGHRRIGFIGVDPNPVSNGERAQRRAIERERLAGYLQAMQTRGLETESELIDLGGSYYSLDHAAATVRRWLNLPAERQPTAIFATCDMLAAGALQEIYDHRLRVPDDLSIIGFDDTYAAHLTPPLTTVEQPMFALGQTAARLALETLEGAGAGNARTERLATRLVVRRSTGPVPPGG